MKVGDKLYCKVGYNKNFIKDKSYEIVVVGINFVGVRGEDIYSYIDPSYGFYIDGNKDKPSDFLSFYDHFDTQKELRKLKLKKINEKVDKIEK